MAQSGWQLLLVPGWLCVLMALLPAFAAYNEDLRTSLGDKRLQELLLKIDSAPNREQVGPSSLQEAAGPAHMQLRLTVQYISVVQ
jgi:hypothetical protein